MGSGGCGALGFLLWAAGRRSDTRTGWLVLFQLSEIQFSESIWGISYVAAMQGTRLIKWRGHPQGFAWGTKGWRMGQHRPAPHVGRQLYWGAVSGGHLVGPLSHLGDEEEA